MLVGVSIKTVLAYPLSLSPLSPVLHHWSGTKNIVERYDIRSRMAAGIEKRWIYRYAQTRPKPELSPDFEPLEPRWSDLSFFLSLSARLLLFEFLFASLSLSSRFLRTEYNGVKTMIDDVTRNRQCFNEPLFR